MKNNKVLRNETIGGITGAINRAPTGEIFRIVGARFIAPVRYASNNNFLRMFGALICLTAMVSLFTCTDVPDYCSRGNRYDPKMQFCFAEKAYPLCSNGEYNPLTEGCNPKDNTVGTRCLDSNFVPVGTPCGGYTINTASAPANGGGITRSANGPSYAAGELVTLVAEPASGYTFAGWAGASTETSPAVTLTMNSNQPLIAMFRPATATLATTAYPPDGGTINREVNGTQVTVTATPQEGHTFSNWEGAVTSTNPSVTVTVDEGQTLVAIFKPNTYTLTVNSSPAAGGRVFVNNTASTGTKAYDVGTVLNVMAQAEDGYNFTGWTLNGAAGTTNHTMTITINNSNQTLTANFVEKDKPVTPPNATYTLTVIAGAGGSVTPSGTQTDIKAGTPVPITATANSGYEFNGWTVTSGGATVASPNSATTTVTLSSNATVTANFRLVDVDQPDGTFALTLNRAPTEGGKVFVNNAEPPLSGITYHPEEKVVTVRAEAAVGYKFTGWTGALNNTSATMTVNMRMAVTLTANFEYIGAYTLTVNRYPAAGGTVFVDNVEYIGVVTRTDGAQVTVRATQNMGYVFTEWEGASTAKTLSVTITMNSDLTLTAYYKESSSSTAEPLTDPRDSKTYRTVQMPDGKTWMAQNLNFTAHILGDSWCYGRSPDSCAKYGRLYDWSTAMQLESTCNSTTCASQVQSPHHQGICPDGWHLPTRQEWIDLVTATGGGARLKAGEPYWDGTDEFGFSALPGGCRRDGSFKFVGSLGGWWSATDGGNAMNAYYWAMNTISVNKMDGYSVRCLRDD